MHSQIAISNAETALMGLLAESPKHPYHIEKDVQFRCMRVWTDLSTSSIYKLLRKLEKQGLVKAVAETTEDNRVRKVYRLTAAGHRVFRQAIRQQLSTHGIAKNPFDVAIYNQDVLSPKEAVDSLRKYGDQLDKSIKSYKALKEFLTKEGCSLARQALALRTVAMLEGERRWLKEYLKEVQHG